ncbi:hypothetical protein BC351_00485 [Paenibacillus ferrarius]|uniref:HTH cro/C1-type domain-containing protein n=1 Tax=Paenibacillus ferrarius TaxID=1469647 RepID=A0A1V4HTC5_9BACL|nr:helix-turn-helix transcriptional regulator [Paenibacillus ferrarius]OPH61753.1 hypothetical protein BC351_00485 [Paenibacillus ferrarius]
MDSRIEFVLEKTLVEIGITKNQLSVEGKIRSNTVTEIANGSAKQIKIETLHKIIDTLNFFGQTNGLRVFTESDVIKYLPIEHKRQS